MSSIDDFIARGAVREKAGRDRQLIAAKRRRDARRTRLLAPSAPMTTARVRRLSCRGVTLRRVDRDVRARARPSVAPARTRRRAAPRRTPRGWSTTSGSSSRERRTPGDAAAACDSVKRADRSHRRERRAVLVDRIATAPARGRSHRRRTASRADASHRKSYARAAAGERTPPTRRPGRRPRCRVHRPTCLHCHWRSARSSLPARSESTPATAPA